MQTPEQARRTVFQLKVTLKEIRPPIWRRFLVPADISLHGLHLVLQKVMGWSNYHLYEFEIAGKEYGEPDPDVDFGESDIVNAKRTKLWKVLPAVGSKFTYTYDFGDDWRHELLVEKVLPSGEDRSYPVCLGGKRNCPPEDCGGPWGYEDLLSVIHDPSHEDHYDKMTWLGGRFDPEAFDLEEVNRALAHR
ncbi:MAG: plasmid pRiA4b ORF-3 family protein [Chloroflexi bacterium]|nr:plasmid pRiA4b ORF-3 family protein [Chloroflexota bacterium]